MDRREFVNLTVGSVITLGGSLFLVSSCGSSGSSNNESPAAPPMQVGTQVVYTTSTDSAHFHTFPIDLNAFATPPAAGVSGSTSTEAGHSHTVAISMADIQNVDGGQIILVTTGSTDGHTHVLTLVLLS